MTIFQAVLAFREGMMTNTLVLVKYRPLANQKTMDKNMIHNFEVIVQLLLAVVKPKVKSRRSNQTPSTITQAPYHERVPGLKCNRKSLRPRARASSDEVDVHNKREAKDDHQARSK